MPIQALKLLKQLESNKLWVDFFIAAADIWQRGIIQRILETLTIPLDTVSGIAQDRRCIILRVVNSPPYTHMRKLALLHQFLTYSRFTALKEVPAGYFPGKATGDGNCFYNSVSLLLHGSEELASWLRLGSAVWAALHLQHYLQAVSNTHIYPCSGSRCRLHTYM